MSGRRCTIVVALHLRVPPHKAVILSTALARNSRQTFSEWKMDASTQWAIAGLVLLLILLIVLLFSKTPFLTLFTADHGWEKLDENSGILEHTSTLLPRRPPVRYSTPYVKADAGNLCYSTPFDGFIKMSYDIQVSFYLSSSFFFSFFFSVSLIRSCY
ncbi:unnamed protein product [Nippostrongylus brasiliensis]|uniref:DUF4792 domain-containing protein n=1 Tax=Nippostrongylus brasiliensis TaxID=27835 RepID=A0A0N4YVW6_NIPBR|nr:unnamed protein product [Nippostrongylus brasiliensis]